MQPSLKKIDKKDACPKCLRPKAQCFCSTVVPAHTGLRVLILQHPQEQYKLLNSASLAHAILENSVLRVGLSWRNFAHALGTEANPKEWGVLYLKSGGETEKPVEFFDGKKRIAERAPKLKGLVAIDGSWKQAKALWWRNPWLLKLNRISLNMQKQSLRPQVKSEGLSTIEALACAFEVLGEQHSVSEHLVNQYADLVIKPSAVYRPSGTPNRPKGSEAHTSKKTE